MKLRGDRRSKRQSEAEARNAVVAALIPKERLEKLDRILGPGVGAKRERARLQKKLAPVASK